MPLIDDVGPDVFDKIADGKAVRLDGDTLVRGRLDRRQGHGAERRVGIPPP